MGECVGFGQSKKVMYQLFQPWVALIVSMWKSFFLKGWDIHVDWQGDARPVRRGADVSIICLVDLLASCLQSAGQLATLNHK